MRYVPNQMRTLSRVSLRGRFGVATALLLARWGINILEDFVQEERNLVIGAVLLLVPLPRVKRKANSKVGLRPLQFSPYRVGGFCTFERQFVVGAAFDPGSDLEPLPGAIRRVRTRPRPARK
jgi:hypothetical protein